MRERARCMHPGMLPPTVPYVLECRLRVECCRVIGGQHWYTSLLQRSVVLSPVPLLGTPPAAQQSVPAFRCALAVPVVSVPPLRSTDLKCCWHAHSPGYS